MQLLLNIILTAFKCQLRMYAQHNLYISLYDYTIAIIYVQKINMKNAFNLQLIDCMSEMLRKKDPEMNNFQAASCTLDASTKIYAYRVDCVHIDTLKMAGGLGRTANEEAREPEADPNESNPDNTVKKKPKVITHKQRLML